MRLSRPDLRPLRRLRPAFPGQTRILERTRVRSFPRGGSRDAFVWIWMGDPTKADVSTIVTLAIPQTIRRNWAAQNTRCIPSRPPAMLDGGQP